MKVQVLIVFLAFSALPATAKEVHVHVVNAKGHAIQDAEIGFYDGLGYPLVRLKKSGKTGKAKFQIDEGFFDTQRRADGRVVLRASRRDYVAHRFSLEDSLGDDYVVVLQKASEIAGVRSAKRSSYRWSPTQDRTVHYSPLPSTTPAWETYDQVPPAVIGPSLPIVVAKPTYSAQQDYRPLALPVYAAMPPIQPHWYSTSPTSASWRNAPIVNRSLLPYGSQRPVYLPPPATNWQRRILH